MQVKIMNRRLLVTDSDGPLQGILSGKSALSIAISINHFFEQKRWPTLLRQEGQHSPYIQFLENNFDYHRRTSHHSVDAEGQFQVEPLDFEKNGYWCWYFVVRTLQ